MFDLTGRIALVTGASGNIGGAIARALSAQGATVILSGTRLSILDILASELGGNTLVLTCNLFDVSSVEKLVKEARLALGSIDVLINNAGLTRDGISLRMKDCDWQNVLDINLSAAFYLSRAVLRDMIKLRFGRIINISSIVGVIGNPGQVNYVASKAGLIGMSKALAQEVASRGITVNCIAPGFINSAMTDALSEDQKNKLISRIPIGRIGDPVDIATAAVYLASNEASYITGQTIHVNGGMVMI
ncbi:MAG: 3-oxoacyl-[acyl-carrier-protein] reductase [Rhodospirillaceae bacterium]|jgi:3-oxoacyl-[acyl-carrier protein] reductase|nr:3-oxoacyl-[acyl-carrier-protein] reductase [Rhodospirillaceae bacterium]